MPDKECFIIMPITTPESYLTLYRDGSEHFKHVLDCLFIPAVEKAGFKPQPPIASGSDLIHAEVIKSLESAEIVLCDMSTLNPNVFFEFGIRTSLNKPVCIVKDDLTTSVPFDTAILNYKEYNSAIEPWNLANDIEIIAKHLTSSVERSKGENSLWKHFGFRAEAIPYESEDDTAAALDYITYQLDSLSDKIDSTLLKRPSSSSIATTVPSADNVLNLVIALLPTKDVKLSMFEIVGDEARITFRGALSSRSAREISNKLSATYGLRAVFIREGSSSEE